MAKTVTDEEVKKVSDMIKIHIKDKDLKSYTNQLNTVFDAIEVLKEFDTNNVKPTSQTHGLKNVMAEDIPEKSLDMSKYKNTKNFKSNYFIVKKLI